MKLIINAIRGKKFDQNKIIANFYERCNNGYYDEQPPYQCSIDELHLFHLLGFVDDDKFFTSMPKYKWWQQEHIEEQKYKNYDYRRL